MSKYSDDFESSDEEYDSKRVVDFKSTDSLLDIVIDITDKLRSYILFNGLNMLTSNNIIIDMMDLIDYQETKY